MIYFKKLVPLGYFSSFSGGSVGKESAYNTGDLGWSLGQEDPLEKEMATQSSFLAWEILWTEEPGGLQSMGGKIRCAVVHGVTELATT